MACSSITEVLFNKLNQEEPSTVAQMKWMMVVIRDLFDPKKVTQYHNGSLVKQFDDFKTKFQKVLLGGKMERYIEKFEDNIECKKEVIYQKGWANMSREVFDTLPPVLCTPYKSGLFVIDGQHRGFVYLLNKDFNLGFNILD